ncbi:MAG: hypothetical protein HZB36_01075 [Candidatus Omnitrophica bacterium]|nr:hypothetical protein [Candidatus Omnitrophota bacterium]
MRPDFTFSQIKKAEKFVKHECIEYKGMGIWVCKPLKYVSKRDIFKVIEYNHTTYTIKSDGNYGFNCGCDGFLQSKKIYETGAYDPLLPKEQVLPKCSHIRAVILFEQLKRKDVQLRRESNQGMLAFCVSTV